MKDVELEISIRDWFYITLIGALFGFFIALLFYFLDQELHHLSTIGFAIALSMAISLLSAFLINISNHWILPNVHKVFWHFISFVFSFISGYGGVLIIYWLFSGYGFAIITTIKPYLHYIAITTGFLSFLIGLILHKVISMKYRHEAIKNDFLESKIKALEEELNPHFLFNALNSISELIYLDQAKAERSILDLSKFLRNVISKESLITLEHELQMVQTYIDIENIRFANHIHFDTYIIQKEILIPKFSIQLLVENAIKHGYLGGVLNIEVYQEKDHIIVQNNGKLEEIRTFGTGLANLKKRLELLQVGTLAYQRHQQMMQFIITLERS